MNSVFLAVSDAERENILNKHREVYNGYRTLNPNPVSNNQPLYVQDFANDKQGLVVNNKGEVKAYTNMGINEGVRDFSPLGYAKRIANGEISVEDAMKESELPFLVLSKLVKQLRGKSVDMREEEMCEQCSSEMGEEEDGGQTDIPMIGDSVMGSQDFQEVFSNMNPNEYEDEFEFADNAIYMALAKYEDKPYYDDLFDYVKDMYSDSLFDAYSVTMGGSDFFGDEDTLDIDYEEIDEIEADDMDVSAVEPGYQFVSHGPEDVYGTMKDYDKEHPHHDYNSMEDVMDYDPSDDLKGMFPDLTDGMAFSDEPSDTFQHDAGDVDREGDEGLGMDTENDMDLGKVGSGFNFKSGGADDPYNEEEDIEEEVDEDLKESFREKRKVVLEMFNRISKF